MNLIEKRWLLLIGLAIGVFLPPGFTSFFLGAIAPKLTGVYLMFYDPSTVDPSLTFFIILYLLAEGGIMLGLMRQGASRAGWLLTALAFCNLLLGISLYQSMIPCGLC